MSVWIQSTQYILIGISEIFASTSSYELFYNNVPETMKRCHQIFPPWSTAPRCPPFYSHLFVFVISSSFSLFLSLSSSVFLCWLRLMYAFVWLILIWINGTVRAKDLTSWPLVLGLWSPVVWILFFPSGLPTISTMESSRTCFSFWRQWWLQTLVVLLLCQNRSSKIPHLFVFFVHMSDWRWIMWSNIYNFSFCLSFRYSTNSRVSPLQKYPYTPNKTQPIDITTTTTSAGPSLEPSLDDSGTNFVQNTGFTPDANRYVNRTSPGYIRS